MKILAITTLVACLLLITASGYAKDFNVGHADADEAIVSSGVGNVYGLSCYATSSGAQVAVYDTTSAPACTDSNLLFETSEATQYATTIHWLPAGYSQRFETGLFALVNNGEAVVYYK